VAEDGEGGSDRTHSTAPLAGRLILGTCSAP
jgi:hypothetical protein